MLQVRSVSSAADQANKCQKSAAAGETNSFSSVVINAGFERRTFVFPFCWPETLAENQKHFEQFSNISNADQLAQLHWHEKLILAIAKRVDYVMASVNRSIWRDTQPQNGLLLKSLSFEEKELFWKFSYVKLGMRILKSEFDDICSEEGGKNSATSATRKTKVRKFVESEKNLNANSGSVSEKSTLLTQTNFLDRELEHLMKKIRKLMNARLRLRNRNEISTVMQSLIQM